jgi:ribosomal protein S6
MSETQMPAAEATLENGREVQTYEFAFHVLPTVAEGEVPGVFDSLKAHITKAGGEIFDEEMPQRFDLAFEIVKYLEGKNRKFTSAYFGWVRFRLTADALAHMTEELDAEKSLLRYLLIKLTKVEEAHPFRFHESIAHRKVETIGDADIAEESEVVEAISEEVVAVEEVADIAEAEVVAPVDGEEVK